MRYLMLAVITLFLVFSGAQAQEPSPQQPSTKIETFQAKYGSVIIKNYSRIGTLRGIGGSVEVTSMEFIDVQTTRREYGLMIEATESGRLERSSRVYIDYDEIDSLIKGIDYTSKIDTSIARLTNFEAKYRTKSDLQVTVFNEAQGLSAGVTVGRISAVSVFFKLADFPAFRKLIVDAKVAIDAIKQ